MSNSSATKDYFTQKINMITPGKIAGIFEYMGGNSQRAVAAAQSCANVTIWKQKQIRQVALVGAAAMLIPVLHIFTLVVDVWFLLHKMAYTCWGIATLHGCQPVGKADLEIILTHWSGELGDEMLDVAIATSAYSGSLRQSAIFTMIPEKFLSKIYTRHAERNVALIFGKKFAVKGAGKLLAKKISAKVLTKIGVKIFAKFVFAFFPLLGVAVAVWLNRYFVKGIAESADKYYAARHKYEVDLLQMQEEHTDDLATEG